MSENKIAVVLMNLGGPDSLEAVQPFLYNLFADKAIINLPSPFRQLLALFISKRRAAKAQKIYARIGGKSPLLENTQAQAQALEQALQAQHPTKVIKIFIAMRYWHPLASATVKSVQDFNPDRVILLPLYPQFSTTTSASSMNEWQRLETSGVPTDTICCYPMDEKFLKAYEALIAESIAKVPTNINLRVLFSAHGLPQKIVDQGDPYQFQVESTVAMIAQNLALKDYRVCYQSRVGPLKWLEPNLDDEIVHAASEDIGVLVVPISFVSEHSETLVELDMDYRERAKELELCYYDRVPTVGCHEFFIASLAELVNNKLRKVESSACCPPEFKNCWCRQ